MTAMFSVCSRPAYASPSRPDLMHMWALSVLSACLLLLSLAAFMVDICPPYRCPLFHFLSDTPPLTAFPSHSPSSPSTSSSSSFSTATDHSAAFLIRSGRGEGTEGLLSPRVVHFFLVHQKLLLSSPWSLCVCSRPPLCCQTLPPPHPSAPQSEEQSVDIGSLPRVSSTGLEVCGGSQGKQLGA